MPRQKRIFKLKVVYPAGFKRGSVSVPVVYPTKMGVKTVSLKV